MLCFSRLLFVHVKIVEKYIKFPCASPCVIDVSMNSLKSSDNQRDDRVLSDCRLIYLYAYITEICVIVSFCSLWR